MKFTWRVVGNSFTSSTKFPSKSVKVPVFSLTTDMDALITGSLLNASTTLPLIRVCAKAPPAIPPTSKTAHKRYMICILNFFFNSYLNYNILSGAYCHRPVNKFPSNCFCSLRTDFSSRVRKPKLWLYCCPSSTIHRRKSATEALSL